MTEMIEPLDPNGSAPDRSRPDRNATRLGPGEVLLSRDAFLRSAGLLGLSLPAMRLLSAAPAMAAPAASISGDLTIINNTGAGREEQAWQQRVLEFQQKFPKVKVNEIISEGTFYALLPKVETLIAGGQPPDGVLCGNYTLALFAARGALRPLDSLIAKDPSVNFNDFFPIIRKSVTYDGKVYALPDIAATYATHYNKTEVKNKHLADPHALWQAGKWNKDTFLKTVTALTEGSGTNKRYGFMFENWNAENWIFLNGGRVLSPDAKTVVLDQPAAYEGLQFAADLVHKYGVAPDPTTLVGRPPYDLFVTGVARSYLVGNWFVSNFINNITNFEYANAGPPHLTSNAEKAEYVSWAVTTKAKNPAAAWEWAKFCCSHRGFEIMSAVNIPTRKSAIGLFGRDYAASHGPNGLAPTGAAAVDYATFVKLLPNATFTPFFANSAQIDQLLTDGLAPLWQGKTTAKQATADIAEKMRKVL